MDTIDVTSGATDTTLLPAMGDACVSCGARLQRDQRYCVECGVRSAPPRLAFMDGRTPHAAEPPAAPVPAAAAPAVSGLTLIAGVATLLLAMGVGVLIGAAGNGASQPPAGARVQVVSVPAAAPPAAALAPDTTTTTPATTTNAHGAKAKTAGKTAAASPSAKKAAAAPKPVKVGSTGHGPGYKNGKFTGDFFGP